MSDFLAEARIVVRPDTSAFRATLEAELRAITAKPIAIPVVAVAGSGVASLTAETTALSAANTSAVVSTQALAAAQEKEAVTATRATAAQTAHVKSVSQLSRGAAASGLTLFGLRGATLAASGAFLAGTAAVVGFSKAVQSAADLETELNVFRVNAGATADEMERVSAASKSLGRDITLPGVTASTAATAMTELAKAGLSVEDSMAGARGALQLATAAQIEVSQSSELVANTLNAFGLQGRDAVKVADLLAGAAKSAQGEIGEFGTALGQVASVADQFGVSAGDTVTLLTQLAKAGLQGGRAGTTLRVAILGLIKPTAAAKVELEKLQKLGVEITKPNGAFDPTAFAQINEALKSYSKEQQNVIRNTIFSSDAIKVLGRATSGGVEDFNSINRSVNEAGLSLEASRARTEGLAGDIENLSNQTSGLGLTIGEVAKGPLSLFVSTLADSVSTVNDAATGVVALGSAIGDLGSEVGDSVPGLGLLGEHLGTIAAVGKYVNPATKSFAFAALAAKQFGLDTETAGGQSTVFGGIIDSVTESMDDLTSSLGQAAATLKEGLPTGNGLNVQQVENIVGGFDAQEVRARIKGSNQEILSILGEEQDFLERQLQRQYVQRRPALKRALEQSLLGVVNDIRTIQDQAASEADRVKRESEQAARDAAAAVRASEQDLLARFGLARDQQQNKIAAAAATAQLTDDIAQQKKLAALVRSQIAAVRERISVEGGRAAAVTALKAILIQVNQSVAALAQQQQAAAEARRQELLQSISLDVELAQITDNQAAEVNARNKKIGVLEQALKREAKLHGKTTVAYKEIRNQIAQERAAIEEIRKEKQKSNQSFAQASFEFLQAQQGFASTLLGNLIPRGATGGLVGGAQTPVQGALQPVAGAAEARSGGGPTAGQAETTNFKLEKIFLQLQELNGGQKAPEAQRQRVEQNSTFDGPGIGWGGG